MTLKPQTLIESVEYDVDGICYYIDGEEFRFNFSNHCLYEVFELLGMVEGGDYAEVDGEWIVFDGVKPFFLYEWRMTDKQMKDVVNAFLSGDKRLYHHFHYNK